MKYDLLHIQGKPYVLVPLHDYRVLTHEHPKSDLPDEILDRLMARQESPLKIIRKYRGFTQKELAELTGISRPYLTEIETGKKDGSIRAMKTLADVLNVDLSLLV
ncbi:MAG: helix-turn-helix transcriptional regulator [Rhodospirillales bacterium]|nr:helix-turn-helix transcriptional regulator [Alphaproteobacteria bacterium]MCB1839124.1 helix-turn-helix transcriptional regulator [Alphaproteobacteria bacterium]MCB9976146.1 helix-turn-helix transcriptional regulator [Rhodospirillales bacterium]